MAGDVLTPDSRLAEVSTEDLLLEVIRRYSKDLKVCIDNRYDAATFQVAGAIIAADGTLLMDRIYPNYIKVGILLSAGLKEIEVLKGRG